MEKICKDSLEAINLWRAANRMIQMSYNYIKTMKVKKEMVLIVKECRELLEAINPKKATMLQIKI